MQDKKEIYFNYEIMVAVKRGSVAAVEAQLQEAGVHCYTLFGDPSIFAASQGSAVSSFSASAYWANYSHDENRIHWERADREKRRFSKTLFEQSKDFL